MRGLKNEINKPTYDMKKLILLLFIPIVFACSSDDEDNTNPVDDTNPVYLDENGVTIKARDWAVVEIKVL